MVVYLPSSIEETDIEFLEYSSIKLLPPETLVALVFVVVALVAVALLVRAEVVVVVQRPPRP